jgi:hypothetical protein
MPMPQYNKAASYAKGYSAGYKDSKAKARPKKFDALGTAKEYRAGYAAGYDSWTEMEKLKKEKEKKS